MHVTRFDIEAGPVLIKTPVHEDDRGCFHESYNAGRIYEALGFAPSFVQDNISRSVHSGTVRGLHMQVDPFAQGKIVQCLQGKVWDVAIDARPGSNTLGQAISVTLSQQDGQMIWVPPGFLHGFVTLTDDSLVSYKVTNPYSREHDISVAWNDPDLNVSWPLEKQPILSQKDQDAMSFKTFMQSENTTS